MWRQGPVWRIGHPAEPGARACACGRGIDALPNPLSAGGAHFAPGLSRVASIAIAEGVSGVHLVRIPPSKAVPCAIGGIARLGRTQCTSSPERGSQFSAPTGTVRARRTAMRLGCVFAECSRFLEMDAKIERWYGDGAHFNHSSGQMAFMSPPIGAVQSVLRLGQEAHQLLCCRPRRAQDRLLRDGSARMTYLARAPAAGWRGTERRLHRREGFPKRATH